MLRKSISELLGTFALVFCGTGAIVIDKETGSGVSHIGIAITFGLIVMSMIYALGDISGPHLNPAFSIAFTLAGRLPVKSLGYYIVSEIAGSLPAILTWKYLNGKTPNTIKIAAT
jgi:aquaporin NIP